MAKDPAVLFYTSDFLSGTSFFTNEQKGQYITLLCQQHQLGEIPENHMIFICGSLDSPVVSKFTKAPNGNYFNERMKLEADKRANYCASRGKNKAGHVKSEVISKSYENHMIGHMENGNEDSIKDISFDQLKSFNDFFEAYPNRIERSRGLSTYCMIVVNKTMHDRVMIATKNYGAHLKNNPDKKKKNPATFLESFTDWEEHRELAAVGAIKKIPLFRKDESCSCCAGTGYMTTLPNIKCQFCWR